MASASRHLWVGGLPDIDEEGIKEYFTKFGNVEGVKILPQRYPNIGLAAFVDFSDVRSAISAKDSKLKLNGVELRTNYKTKLTEKYDHPSYAKDGARNRDSSPKYERTERSRAHQRSRTPSTSSSSSVSGSSSSSSSSSSDSDSEPEEARAKKKGKRKSEASGDTCFVKITGLAVRPDHVLQDGLHYEFARYGSQAVVRLYGEGDKIHAVVKFKRSAECKAALKEAQGLLLFGSKIKLSSLDREDFPSGGRDPGGSSVGGRGPPQAYLPEDLDPQATRSLFVGNIPKNITVYELRDIFQRHGNVLDVEIKKMSGNATYGFVLFYDIGCAISAKQYMDGANLGGNFIRVGFGKGTPSRTIWVDGLHHSIIDAQFERHMEKFGKIMRFGVDRAHCCAMVQYESNEIAKEALTAVKGTYIENSRRLLTDFANRDARAAFFARLEGGGEGGGGRIPFPGGPSEMFDPGMGPRGGAMMIPHGGGMPMMGMGRGGFPRHGPPIDYYYRGGAPFMDDGMYYGGRPPFHGRGGPVEMGRFRPPFEEGGYDDYDDELRAFTRKREIEREREKRREKRRGRGSSSKSNDSDSGASSPKRRKKLSKDKRDKSKERKKSSKKAKAKEKDASESDEEKTGSEGDKEAEMKEAARLQATQKSRDLREKLRKKAQGKQKDSKDVVSLNTLPTSSGSENESEAKKSKKSCADKEKQPVPAKGKDREKKEREPARDKDPEKEQDKSRSDDGERAKEKEKVTQSLGERKADKSGSRKRRPRTPSPRAQSVSPPAARDGEKENGKAKGKVSEKKAPKEREKGEGGKAVKTIPLATLQASHRSPPPRRSSKEMSSSVHHRGGSKKNGHSGNTLRSPVNTPSAGATPVEETHDMTEEEEEEEGMEVGPADTPLSPPPTQPAPIMASRKEKIESDLSSGEDFKEEEEGEEPGKVEIDAPKPGKEEKERVTRSPMLGEGQGQRVAKPPRPRTPESEHSSGEKPPLAGHKRPPSPAEESDDKASDGESSRKPKRLPRRYQLEEEEAEKQWESREPPRFPRRHYPPSPSPPPVFIRRRHYHSPPPGEYLEKRWQRRGRPFSPGHRRFSRSPPSFPPSPLRRPRSPFSGSPPPPRARTPIQRPGREHERDRGPPPPHSRHRFGSPPYDSRSKYLRRGSPPSPHRHYSPSPPPPRMRSPGRRYPRHRTPSVSPPRRSPLRRSPLPPRRSPPPPRRSPPPLPRRDRSRSPERKASPKHPDERYRNDGRRFAKRPVHSRTPSPKAKRHDPPKEPHPDFKRRRLEESRPKTPPTPAAPPPPLPKDEPKPPLQSEKPLPQAPSASNGAGSGKQPHPPPHPPPGAAKTAPASRGGTQLAAAHAPVPPGTAPQNQADNNLLDLLRRYPVMWQGHLSLKNDAAAVQLHFLSGNASLAKLSLPVAAEQRTPTLRIDKRMRLEQTQLEGVERRMQNDGEHCLLLALPCGRDANDVRTQTHALKNSLISYLLQKQAAGIINVTGLQTGYVLHIFPPCPFSQTHLSRVAPDLLSSASDNCHFMIVVATM